MLYGKLGVSQIVEVPAVPFSDPNNYVHVARRLSDVIKKSERSYDKVFYKPVGQLE